MTDRRLGCIVTPAQRQVIPARAWWCADNGRFGKGWPGDLAYEAWLASLRSRARSCVLALAPDVPFDMPGTLAVSRRWLPLIARMGYPPALALQNGAEATRLPWDDIAAVFIGGDTAWKTGPAAAWLISRARARGKHIHMGRVNSLQRLRYAWGAGCDSCDGTYLTFGPDKNLPRLLAWLRELDRAGGQTFITYNPAGGD